MIILLGFKAFGDFEHEYQLSGDDLLRLAQFLNHPLPPGSRTNAVGYVTIHHGDLTDDFCNDKLTSTRGDSGNDPDLFDRS